MTFPKARRPPFTYHNGDFVSFGARLRSWHDACNILRRNEIDGSKFRGAQEGIVRPTTVFVFIFEGWNRAMASTSTTGKQLVELKPAHSIEEMSYLERRKKRV